MDVYGKPVSATSDTGAPEDTQHSQEWRWLIGIWVLVAVFAVITAWRSEVVGVPMRDPEGQMFRGRLTSALVLFAVLTVLDAVLRARPAGWSPRRIAGVWRARWTPERLVLALSGLLAYHLVYVCYRNLKSWDAFNTVQDEVLLDLDRWLFAGHSPAVLLHDLVGEGAAAVVLMVVYKSFTYLAPFSVVASLVFIDRIRDGYVFLVSALWIWILGVASYYLVPSLGPFASAPGEFAGLRHTAITDTQAEYLRERAHLLADPSAGDAFASISAFASLHVGFTCMVWLMLRYYRFRRTARVMGIYLLAVMVSTVYFGWHFVLDDVAGVLLAVLAVALGRVMVYPHGRPPVAARSQESRVVTRA